MTKIILPPGITSVTEYEVALQLTVARISASLELARNELFHVQCAIRATQFDKLAPVAKPKKPKAPLVIDVDKPLTTQVQALAKYCGLAFSNVYGQKTKTKGRKVKLHHVYSGSLRGPKLSAAKFAMFETELRRVMADFGTTINSVEMVMPPKGSGSWHAPSIVVFFA